MAIVIVIVIVIVVVNPNCVGRWRTLLSVDDMVAGLVERLDTEQLLDNTYIIYTRSHWVTAQSNPQSTILNPDYTNPQTTITKSINHKIKSTIPKPKSATYHPQPPIFNP